MQIQSRFAAVEVSAGGLLLTPHLGNPPTCKGEDPLYTK